jgi:hypothetical protein
MVGYEAGLVGDAMGMSMSIAAMLVDDYSWEKSGLGDCWRLGFDVGDASCHSQFVHLFALTGTFAPPVSDSVLQTSNHQPSTISQPRVSESITDH